MVLQAQFHKLNCRRWHLQEIQRGKSSLINALMNRKSYARTSSQPGKTQTINYYNINDAMFLVDLPGYGYANANQQVKAKWGKW